MSKKTVASHNKHYCYILCFFLRNETFLPITPIVSIQAPVPVNTSENNAIMVSFPVVSIYVHHTETAHFILLL